MFTIVWKKMVKNKWMTLCLLLGSLFVVNAMCIVPMYTQGILERMLKKDFERSQISTGAYPGRVNINRQFYLGNYPETAYDRYENTMTLTGQQFLDEMAVPLKGTSKLLYSKNYKAISKGDFDPQNAKKSQSGQNSRKSHNATLGFLEGLEQNSELVAGKYPSSTMVDGAYEVMVNDVSEKERDWILGSEYILTYEIKKEIVTVPVKVVGIYRTTGDTLFWKYSTDVLKSTMLMNGDSFNNEFCVGEKCVMLGGMSLTYSFDYTQIKMEDTQRILDVIQTTKEVLKEEQVSVDSPMVNIFITYQARKSDMTMVLWVLQMPLILMLIFYIVMVSKKTIDYDKNEISVLRSRGCTSKQVMTIYLLQSSILAAIAFLIGPIMSFFVCKLLGSSNGFLEFVNRASLPVVITTTIYLYALAVAILFIIMVLIPVYGGIKVSIVEHKVRKNRKSTSQLWKKMGLDIILLAGSLYILFQYKQRQQVLITTGALKTDFPVDPTIFVASTMFIVGAGLLFARIYPFLIKLIFNLLKKVMGSTLYFAMLNVSRSLAKNNFIMLFLILTLATGIFDANCARTINQNEEDRIKYQNGGQISLTQEWEAYLLDGSRYSPGGMGAPTPKPEEIIYLYEPPLTPITDLDSVEEATRVFSKDKVDVSVGAARNKAKLMAIEPNGFNKVAWNRKWLNDYSMYSYLKTLASNPYAVLVSTNYRDEHEVKIGDKVSVSYGSGTSSFEGVVYGFIDYWPTYSPVQSANNKAKDDVRSSLVVANLSYVQQKTMLEPYDVWVKLKPEATTEMFYKDIEENNIVTSKVSSANQLIMQRKNDPMIQGINGMLTIGLILTMIVCFVGFLIYWILDIKSRTLQLGILRSMGLSKASVIMILVYEQIFISISSIIAGVVIGTVGSKLFVPILEIATQVEAQVPPYVVMSAPIDYIRICGIVLVMLAVSIAVLWKIIVKININQALKLGED